MFVPGFNRQNNQNTEIPAGKIALMDKFYTQMNQSVGEKVALKATDSQVNKREQRLA